MTFKVFRKGGILNIVFKGKPIFVLFCYWHKSRLYKYDLFVLNILIYFTSLDENYVHLDWTIGIDVCIVLSFSFFDFCLFKSLVWIFCVVILTHEKSDQGLLYSIHLSLKHSKEKVLNAGLDIKQALKSTSLFIYKVLSESGKGE